MDYHKFETQYRASVMRLWKCPNICHEDKEAIEQFLHHCKSNGVGWARLRKLCQEMMTCVGFTRKL